MKPYVKPELFYESFEMNQSIAACRWDLNEADKNNCSADYDFNLDNSTHIEVNLFVTSNTCSKLESEMSPEEYCYQNGAANIKTLQS